MVRPPYLNRLASRARRTIGIPDLTERLSALEATVADLARRSGEPSYPRGPLYFGDRTALVTTRWGGRMIVDTQDVGMAPWLALDGLWEAHVTEWLQSTLAPGHVFVDVGANIGYFTILGAQLVGPSGRVIAVEAHPHLAGILRRNVVMNGYHGYVEVHAKAAWSQATELSFHAREHYTSGSSLGEIGDDQLTFLGDSSTALTVPAVKLDDLLAERPRVDVVKIDVEGAETHAIEGLATTIEANPQIQIMLEWGRALIDAMGEKPLSLVELLERHRFRLQLLETGLPIEARSLLELPYGNVVARR